MKERGELNRAEFESMLARLDEVLNDEADIDAPIPLAMQFDLNLTSEDLPFLLEQHIWSTKPSRVTRSMTKDEKDKVLDQLNDEMNKAIESLRGYGVFSTVLLCAVPWADQYSVKASGPTHTVLELVCALMRQLHPDDFQSLLHTMLTRPLFEKHRNGVKVTVDRQAPVPPETGTKVWVN